MRIQQSVVYDVRIKTGLFDAGDRDLIEIGAGGRPARLRQLVVVDETERLMQNPLSRSLTVP